MFQLVLVEGVDFVFLDVIVAVVFILPESDQIGRVCNSQPVVDVKLFQTLLTVPHPTINIIAFNSHSIDIIEAASGINRRPSGLLHSRYPSKTSFMSLERFITKFISFSSYLICSSCSRWANTPTKFL